MTRKLYLAAAAVLGAITLCPTADATTMLLLSREELVSKSHYVARVTVGKAVTEQSADKRGIVTRTDLRITTCLKGPCPDNAIVEQVGGTYNGKTQVLLGDGTLRPGEDAVVFLRHADSEADPDSPGASFLTALALSVYHVDGAGFAARDLSGLGLMRRNSDKIEPIKPDERPEPVETLMTDIVRLAETK